jgi:hypothetical protein
MSIRDQIQKLLNDGLLFCVESEMTGDDTVGAIFASKEVFDAVMPPFQPGEAVLMAEFRASLDAFLEGCEQTVAEDPFEKPAYALMARVAPVTDEFWDFRITSPHPGIRALGAFSERDTFVCLTWEYREVIGEDFNAEVDRCKAEWQKLFGDTPPFKGNNLDAYLTNYIAI